MNNEYGWIMMVIIVVKDVNVYKTSFLAFSRFGNKKSEPTGSVYLHGDKWQFLIHC